MTASITRTRWSKRRQHHRDEVPQSAQPALRFYALDRLSPAPIML